MECHKPNLKQKAVIEVSNVYFAMVFGVECILRLVVHTPNRFFSSLWFCFDYFAVIMSFVVIGVEESNTDNQGVTVNPTMLRMFRIIKVIKTIR